MLKAAVHLTISVRGQRATGKIQRKCHFLPGGGAPENWGGSGTLSKIKRGDQKIFQIKKGGSLIFFKEIKYFVNRSWNSC